MNPHHLNFKLNLYCCTWKTKKTNLFEILRGEYIEQNFVYSLFKHMPYLGGRNLNLFVLWMYINQTKIVIELSYHGLDTSKHSH
jgi:hypothetical protein